MLKTGLGTRLALSALAASSQSARERDAQLGSNPRHQRGRVEFEFEAEAEQEGEYETLGEMEQLELAAELLEVSNEQELENFFGDVFRKVGKGVSDFAKSSTGQALGGILKQAASKALPVIGGAAGGFLGGPVGASVGSWAADQAGKAMGLELEGLSHDDKQFEVAQQFVKLAGDAAAAAAAAHGAAPPNRSPARLLYSAQERPWPDPPGHQWVYGRTHQRC